MAKYDVTLEFPSNDSRMSLDLEGVELDSTDGDEALRELADYIVENSSVSRTQVTYEVTIQLRVENSVTFSFEDESGDYEDEDEVQMAFENGDIDWTDYASTDDAELAVESVDVTVE